MKRLIILFILAVSIRQTEAQIVSVPPHRPFEPDMQFVVDFSGGTDLFADADNFYGIAGYYRNYVPILTSLEFTNWFYVSLVLPAPAQNAWLLEKQSDDSFLQITNLNQFNGGDIYYLGQTMTLTTNQIYSLITGNWYVSMDIGESNYLGHITPVGAQGPFIGLPFVYGFRSSSFGEVISPNNRNAKVVFNGSHASDYFYLPIQYVWTVEDEGGAMVFSNTDVITTNNFDIGHYTLTFQLSDGVVTADPVNFPFGVVTAGQAVDEIIRGLPPLELRTYQIMVKILSNAKDDFNRGRMDRGCAQLRTFIQFVKSQHLNDYTTSNLQSRAQNIIDAVKNP